MPPPAAAEAADDGDIRPRTLDMSGADPLNVDALSLSPMNMSSPPAAPQQHPKAGRSSRVLEDPANLPIKRMRRELLAGDPADEQMPPAAPLAVPVAPQRANSMAETKMLFNRQDSEVFKFEDHFVWQQSLGSGSFADVVAVRHKARPQERYAIKRSKNEFHSRKQRAEFLREVQLANAMPSHPNVVEYFRAWQDSFFFYVQMELCEGGTLRHLMQREGETLRAPEHESRVWNIVLHIARGLGHIHAYQVLHCDLKPDNILISSDGSCFKIGDLGMAIALKSWDEQEGDACYLSRDLLESNPSTAADIFSFGIMLYEIKSGETLPGSGDRWKFLRNGNVPPPAGCGPELASLIQRMMAPQLETRPTANDILSHCCAAMASIAMAAAMRPRG